MYKTVKMLEKKYCYFCDIFFVQELATYDAKTNRGPWAYVCDSHYILECDSTPHFSMLSYENCK